MSASAIKCPTVSVTHLTKRPYEAHTIGHIVIVPVYSIERIWRNVVFDPPHHGSENVVLRLIRQRWHSAGCLRNSSECIRAVSALEQVSPQMS